MPTYVVVGAILNVGLAFTRQLAKDESNLVIGINRRAPKETIKGVHDVRADLNDLESLRTAAKEVDEIAEDGVDVLICSAGYGQLWNPSISKGEEELLGEQLTEAFKVNVAGHLQLISLLLPALRRGKAKKICYLSSAHGHLEQIKELKMPGRLPYGISKAAANMAILRIANELQPQGFTVFCINPSFVHDMDNIKRLQKVDTDAEANERVKMIEAGIRKATPDHEGRMEPDQGAQIMLEVIGRFGPEDSGRNVGMWGTEDRW